MHERHLGCTFLKAEVLRAALDRSQAKKRPSSRGRCDKGNTGKGGDAGISGVALQFYCPAGQASSHMGVLQEGLDYKVLALIVKTVATRPTFDYRRIAGVLSHQMCVGGMTWANRKTVLPDRQPHYLLSPPSYSERPDHIHDGKVIVMSSNLRCGSNGSELSFWRRYDPRCLRYRCHVQNISP